MTSKSDADNAGAKNVHDELSELGSGLRQLSTIEDAVELPLQSLITACEQLDKVSSGSWMGYQADVYYEGFRPVPNGAVFSSEWGLMLGGYPIIGGTKGRWRKFREDEIVGEILKLAKSDEHFLKSIRITGQSLSQQICRAKDSLDSILAIEIQAGQDTFLVDLSKRLAEISVPTYDDILKELTPTRAGIVRDMVAFNEGLRVPHHRRISIEINWLRALLKSASILADVSETAGKHLKRRGGKNTMTSPRVLEHADEIILAAYKSSKKELILEGATLRANPEVRALNEEAARYCYDNGLARPGKQFWLFILTHSGIQYAKDLLRTEREREISAAAYKILEAAEGDHWKVRYCDSDKLVQVAGVNVADTDDEQSVVLEAFDRLLNEKEGLRLIGGKLYKVTDKGRAMLTDRVLGTQKQGASAVIADSDNRKVFIVHGRDTGALHAVEALIRKLDLQPVVLFDESNKGRTLIEKFEQEAEPAAFAIVLLTPDDIGGLKVDSGDEQRLQPRARQNVVFELGFFVGKLKRNRVLALVKDHVEHPSDIHGIVYVEMDKNYAWQTRVAKEMREAGLPVNMEKL